MSDWQERITSETAPAIRAEHELRYRLAAPVILAGGPWADLGCGNGIAAAAALGEQRPPGAVLVDLDADAVARAAHEIGMPDAAGIAADLTDPGDLARIGESLLALGGQPAITCFEVVEHLASFLPLLAWARGMASEHGATVVLSVPNDAFWAISNPHHMTTWSEGAFAELRGLLPVEHTLLRQVALAGSAVVGWDGQTARYELAVGVGRDASIATHFIAAFGPRHEALWQGAIALETDLLEQRRWERQRESDTAVAQHDISVAQQAVREYKVAVAAQDTTIARQARELKEQTEQFDEWRTYIHTLERELGRPPSGGAAEPLHTEPAAAKAGPAAADADPTAAGGAGGPSAEDHQEPPA